AVVIDVLVVVLDADNDDDDDDEDAAAAGDDEEEDDDDDDHRIESSPTVLFQPAQKAVSSDKPNTKGPTPKKQYDRSELFLTLVRHGNVLSYKLVTGL
ncbi:hypothetical protein DPMN_032740, partial [Dreissena polymorpha]